MDLYQLLQFCRAYASLGTSVQDQLDAAARGDITNQNPNALRMAADRFLSVVKRSTKGRQNLEDLHDEVLSLMALIEEDNGHGAGMDNTCPPCPY